VSERESERERERYRGFVDVCTEGVASEKFSTYQLSYGRHTGALTFVENLFVSV
jgi:hypothetical protein